MGPAFEAEPFLLGLNLPWTSASRDGVRRSRAGWDFGAGPPGWWDAARTPLPRSWEETRADLDRIRALGVRDVRFFVLLHGSNYPVGEALESYGALRGSESRWVFDPPSGFEPPRLPAAFLRDFDGLLRACEEAGVRLWPSLLGFEFFGELRRYGPYVTSGGRSAMVFGASPSRRERERAIERFLEATLEPLLGVARARPSSIGAFEVVNEPDWAVSRGAFGRRGGSVPAASMGRLLTVAARRIAEAGLLSTIGFADADPPWLLARDRRELLRLARRGAYVHQLHHYPGEHRPRRLVEHASLPIRPCIVGELASAPGSATRSANMRWEDPGLAEMDARRFLVERLALVRRLGYRGAFVWALHSEDVATSWRESQADQIRRFSASLSG